MQFLKRYLIPGTFSIVFGFIVWAVTGEEATGFIIGLLTNLTFLSVEHFNLVWRVSRYLDTHGEIVDGSDHIVNLASRVRDIETNGTALMRSITHTAISRSVRELEDLSHGRWTVQSFEEFVDVAEQLFERFGNKKEYWGTSICREYSDYWPNALGRRFLDASVAALKRGAKIKRIFVFAAGEEFSRYQTVMEVQSQFGIEVRYLFEADIPPGTAVADFGIWDVKYAVELSESRYKGAQFKGTFLLLESEAIRLSRTFKSLYEASTLFEPKKLPKEQQPLYP